jgi:hypothetical protein
MSACVCLRICRCGCTGAGICLRSCSFIYPACSAHAPYCLRPLWLHHGFRHDCINSTILVQNITEHKMIFSTTFTWNSSHSKKNSARYCHKCEYIFMWSIRYSCRVLMKLFSTNFRRKMNSNFIKICPVGAELFRVEGRTEIEANSCFSQFADAPKNPRCFVHGSQFSF